METQSEHSSLSCELKIIRAKNIELKTTGELFVRCYLSAGTNQIVQLNTQKISSKSNFFWGQTFSLNCSGAHDSINSLKQGSVVFELRKPTGNLPVLGRINGSKILGRAEIPWKQVFESQEMEIEKWVFMDSKKNTDLSEELKPPAVQIAMKIEFPVQGKTRRKIGNWTRNWDECGCRDGMCNYCVDYDVFAIGLALEAL